MSAGLPVHTRAGDGPTLLWVHGYTLDGSIWGPIWDRLPEFAHVAPDLPGHGAARPLRAGDTLADIARAALDCADFHGAEQLVGLSFGGMVALEAAIRAPRRFRRIVLASPGLVGGPQDAEAATCNQELEHLARTRGIGPWLTERWMAVPPRIFEGTLTRPALRASLEAVVARHGWRELGSRVMMGLLAQDQTPARMAAIRSDLLLLVGEADMPAFLRAAEIIRRSVPGARRETVPRAAHLCLLEEPDACAALIRAHVGAVVPHG